MDTTTALQLLVNSGLFILIWLVQLIIYPPFAYSEKEEFIHESVDLLGFWFETKAYEKNNHRHIVDITRIVFSHNEGIEPKDSKSTGSSIDMRETLASSASSPAR